MAASVCLHLPSGAFLHRSKISSLLPLFLRSPNSHCSPRKGSSFYEAVGFGVGSDLLPVPLFADSPPARKALFRVFSVPDPGKGLRLEEVAIGDRDIEFCGRKGEIWTVVILGWLGADKKHLKKYADFYKARGIRPVLFVVPLFEAFGFDFGRRMEERIAMLASELADWCSERESDGTERRLLFHTFSNFGKKRGSTKLRPVGNVGYGSILMNLQSRGDVVVKIKGCIVDSGPAPEINPKIWAAGFCAALMKKSTCANISHELANGDTSCGNNKGGSKVDWKSSLLEITTKFILERFFALFLFLPIVERKLGAVISVLSKNQPSCPQLYLYSSADRVIPASLVESFIKEQKSLGKAVRSYDFCTSSHVDHFRCFRRRYSAEVDGFLDCCHQ